MEQETKELCLVMHATKPKNYMPFAIEMAHRLARQLTKVRKEGEIAYLRPDGKTQVTVEYEDDKPKRIETILIRTNTYQIESMGANETRYYRKGNKSSNTRKVYR